MVKITKAPQWKDKGTYKEPKDSDNIRVPRLEVDDATTYIDKDGSDNMTFTDAVTGTKTLAECVAAGAGTVDTSGTPVDNDYAKFTDADTVEGRNYTEVKEDLSLDNVENTAHSTDAHTMSIDGRDVSVDGTKLDGIASGADVTGSNAPQAHHDLHDPQDGSDALDCAAPSELAGVQATGEGSAHEFARADHAHQIQHSIADNHLVTIDGTSNAPVNTDYAKFTASGLEGMAKAQILSDLNVADGADVTGSNAPQAHATLHADGTDDIQNATSAQKGVATATQITKLDGIATGATVYPDTGEQAFLDADHTKLDAIAANATKYPDTGEQAFLDADHSKLDAIGAGADVVGPASSTDNEIARQHSTTGKILQTYTSNPPTISDLGDMNIDGDLDVENIVVSGNVDGKDVSGLATAAESVAAVEAAGLTFAENKGIALDAVLSDDGKYSGIVTKQFNGGATIPFGEIMYLKATDSEWYQAKADVTATSGAVMVGICVLATTNGNACTALLMGKIRADAKFPTFTISAPVFISAATAGLLTSTAPTGTTNFVVRIVGHAGTGDELYFNPDNSYIELA